MGNIISFSSAKDTVIFNCGLKIPVSKIAVTIGNLSIYWYGIIITLGIVLALVFGLKQAKKYGLDPNRMIDVIIAGMFGGFLGARIYYVLFSLDEYKSFKDIINVRDGGLAIYGGILGALLFGFIFAKIRKLKFAPMLDIAGQGFLIGQAIGRWGNFFNCEAFGGNTDLPWGMTSQSIKNYILQNMASIGNITSTKAVHPTFLYESIWCIIGFILLKTYAKHRKFDGEVFLMYAGWYGLGRFFIEGLRTDSLMLGEIRVSQLLAGLSVAGAVIAIIMIRSHLKRSGDYVYYKDTEESKRFLDEYNRDIEKRKSKKEEKKLFKGKHVESDLNIEKSDEK